MTQKAGEFWEGKRPSSRLLLIGKKDPFVALECESREHKGNLFGYCSICKHPAWNHLFCRIALDWESSGEQYPSNSRLQLSCPPLPGLRGLHFHTQLVPLPSPSFIPPTLTEKGSLLISGQAPHCDLICSFWPMAYRRDERRSPTLSEKRPLRGELVSEHMLSTFSSPPSD